MPSTNYIPLLLDLQKRWAGFAFMLIKTVPCPLFRGYCSSLVALSLHAPGYFAFIYPVKCQMVHSSLRLSCMHVNSLLFQREERPYVDRSLPGSVGTVTCTDPTLRSMFSASVVMNIYPSRKQMARWSMILPVWTEKRTFKLAQISIVTRPMVLTVGGRPSSADITNRLACSPYCPLNRLGWVYAG